MKTPMALAPALVLLVLAAVTPAAADVAGDVAGTLAGEEQLVNGGFEAWTDGRPDGWSVVTGASEGEGAASTLRPGPDPSAGTGCLVLAGDDSTRRWQAVVQDLAAAPGAVYRFSGRLRGEDVRRGDHRFRNAQAAITARTAAGERINTWVLGPVAGTTEWTRFESWLQTPLGAADLSVSVFLSMNGVLACDGLALERVDLPGPDPEAPREQRWRTDIGLVADLLPRLHAMPLSGASLEDFQVRAAELASAAGELSDLQINLRLMALAASLGDAHTGVDFGGRPHPLPIRMELFGDDLRVLAVDRSCAALAGGRVVRIGRHDVADCLAAVRPLIACETESWFRHMAPQVLGVAEILHGLGLSDSLGRVEIAVAASDGEQRACTLVVPTPGEAPELEISGPVGDDRPLYLSGTGNYWYRHLEPERTFYLRYERCREDAGRPMAGFTSEVAAYLDAHPVDRFVLDLRGNGGGSSGLLDGLIRAIAERKEAGEIGRCYVITDRATFSAACLNTLDFRRATGAAVVGEPMGNKPNRFGQANFLTLPNSGLHVQYATKRFVRMEGDPPELTPDIPVETTWEDYLAGRDPALERILADG